MEKSVFDKEILCPVCKKKFITKKVKSWAIRIEKKDTDLCVHYKTVNPYFYAVYVCQHCGHSATETKFEILKREEIEKIKSNISQKWISRNYGGIRTDKDAIICYKLALNEGVVLNCEKSYLGNICLKIAWIYRTINDTENEKKFMSYALENFLYAYDNENMSGDNMDESTISYLIGELNNRLLKYDEAISWFQICIKHPNVKIKKGFENMIRDQWKEAIEKRKLSKGDYQNDTQESSNN